MNRDKANGLEDGMKKGEYRYYKSQVYPSLLLTYWWETILVKALSNCIKPKHIFYKLYRKIRDGVKYKEAPLVFKEYSKNAKGVDLANNLAQTYRNIHRTSHWWHVIFNHYLTVSLNNAYNIYKHNQDKLKSVFAYLTRKEFIFVIIRKLIFANGLPNIKDIDFHLSNNIKYKNGFTGFTDTEHETNNNNLLIHIPEVIAGFERFNHNDHGKAYTSYKRLICNLCNRRTIFYCKDCENGYNSMRLCIGCFESYHKEMFLKLEEKKRKTKLNPNCN